MTRQMLDELIEKEGRLVFDSIDPGYHRNLLKALTEFKNIQESCDDCISREAVLAMSDYIGEGPTLENPYAEVEEVVRVKDILALPPVTPIPKKGRPIYDIDSQDWEFNRPFKCPFCNERLDCDIHYCPNCGAEMEE